MDNKTKQINIKVNKDTWKDFGIVALSLGLKKHELLDHAIEYMTYRKYKQYLPAEKKPEEK